MTDLLTHIKTARRVSVPLLAIATSDQPACMQRVLPVLANGSGQSQSHPVLVWDLAEGLRPLNQSGAQVLPQLLGDLEQQVTQDPVMAFKALAKLPSVGAAVALNADRILDAAPVVQAIQNLRDRFKQDGRMLVLLAPALKLPAALQHDVFVLDEPLPTPDELRSIVASQYEAAGLERPDEALLTQAASALRGLSAFAAEQATALSLTKQGVRVDTLWTRKVQMVNETPGLQVWSGAERFDTLGGLGQIKGLLTRILRGRQAPQAIVFLDEIEKALAGATGPIGDSSGVSQDALGCLLSHMQDRGAAGLIFVGPPGTAKSAVAKAAGAEGGIPTIRFDLGATKGSLVGESEQKVRQALKIIDAVSDGRALWIATCNKVAVLPPELRRRFKFGTVFFDLPDDAERAAIWRIYRGKFDLPADDPSPADVGWTGAEIETCCQLAWQLMIPLQEAARYIVPVSQAAPEAIEELRRQAEGRYLSASAPGVYRRPQPPEPTASRPAGRAIAL
jgi:hypothetical protein